MDNKEVFAIINSRIAQSLGNYPVSFAELIHQKNQASKSADLHKEFLVAVFLASQFLQKSAQSAAEDWIKKAKSLVPLVSTDPTVMQDISILEKLEKMISETHLIKDMGDDKSLLDKLVEGLLRKPMTRVELIEFLFDSVDFEAAENRLKNLMHRARKQFPNQIVKANGVYSIPVLRR